MQQPARYFWQTTLNHFPSSFPVSYAVDGRQYIAIIRGQPGLLVGSLYGIISGLLSDQGGSLGVPVADPAILVFALD